MDPAAVVAIAAAAVAFVGGAAAVWATRLSRMAVALLAVVIGVAAVGLLVGGPPLALLLALGGTGLVVPATAAVVVVDLDGRSGRTLRPWKLLLLTPLPLLAALLAPAMLSSSPSSSPSSSQSSSSSVELALLALAAAGPAVLLLVRRRESVAP